MSAAAIRLLPVLAALALGGTVASSPAAERETGGTLRSVESFAAIRDPEKRSAALFVEAGKVIQHPRCLNCHPATRIPTQGDHLRPHVPPMVGGASDHGAAGLPCATCHGAENVPTNAPGIKTIPGNPHWGLAPAEMAWQGRSLAQICEQVKDPQRNGGFTLQKLIPHMGEDHLVGWAWHPGEGRTPAPGTQAQFGALIKAWVESGAHCPAA
ncbi:hypothetical protein FHS96_004260 [Sphingomonas zeicaulis]|uniref:Isoquinoline 1-oxidoreductase subunit n=1 Tax=Sphingomonas zeicaulis TaxID=1632740 RepID=UPI003D20E908